MKKIMCSFSLCIASLCLYAQKEPPLTVKKDTSKPQMMVHIQPVQVSNTIDLTPGIKVFEKPNYQGQSVSFTKNAEGKFVFPFPVQHVSIRIPDSVILYVRTCFEFPSENAYTISQGDINLETLCGIRKDVKAKLRVTLNGISTEIHNKDCLRFGGKIEVKVMETSPDAAGVESQMRWTVIERGAPFPGNDRYTFPIFDHGTTQLTDSRYAVELNRGIIFNNNPVPHLAEQAHYGSRIAQNTTNVFIVGRSALQSGRVKVWVKTDLTSAHKTCDLCDDFSSNVKMTEPGYASIPINKTYDGGKIVNAANPFVVLGPYPAHGSRAGFAITATSGTNKNFRVHLKINKE